MPNTEKFHLYGAQCLSLNVLKRTKCKYFEHSPRDSDTVSDSFGGHSRTRDSS